jgi:hypothetical protein
VRKFKFTKKRVIIVLAAIGVLALSGAAVAYFTGSGSGTGTATVGSASTVTVSGTVADSLFPGSASDVAITVENTGSGPQHVGSVHLDSVDVDSGHSTCDTSAFSMDDVSVDQTLDKNGGVNDTAHVTGSLQMSDSGSNQDGCQGATLTLNLSSN